MYHYEEYALGKKFTLSNGQRIPAVGLNTYRLRKTDLVHAILDYALDTGYRLFDTAPLFFNEGQIREAFAQLLSKHHLDRSEIMISSKLVSIDTENGECVRSAFFKTLKNLGLDYIDMYVISSSLENHVSLAQAWATLRDLQSEGFVRSIGVANFSIAQLREITENCYNIPVVNQVEYHPLIRNDDLYEFCKQRDILIQAYSPFGSPLGKYKRLFHNRIIRNLALKYEVTASQILLMWCLQRDVAVLPSTCKQKHLRDNIEFELKLTCSELSRISSLAPDPDDPYHEENNSTTSTSDDN